MTLVRFKAQNHRQQVAKSGARPEIDDRATSPEVFESLNARFAFTVDVAAQPHNAKCPRFFDPAQDGLAQSWAGEIVWCNPPYSSIEPWLIKAWDQAGTARGIVMLLPANRTEQGWWQRRVEPYRDQGAGFHVEFLAGRVRFIAAGATAVGPNERPPFGSVLLIWGPTRRRRSEKRP